MTNGCFLDSSSGEVLNSLRDSGRGVVIFGAGRLGNAALSAARFLGVNTVAFCDNNAELWGKLVQGVPVFSPEAAAEKFPDAYFIIALLRFTTMFPQLREVGIDDRCLTLDLVTKAAERGGPSVPEELADSLRLTCFTQRSLLGAGLLFLGNVSLMVTERCSLRCRNCSNLTPYFKHPAKWTANYLLETLDSFLSYVDGVGELRLMGGDAMMHPDIRVVAEQALRRRKITTVIIYTNAIIPLDRDEWRDIGNRDQLVFSVTDYGFPRQDIATLANTVQALGSKLKVVRLENWCKIGIGGGRRLDERENRRIFTSCSSAMCTNIYEGGVYRCAIAPAAVRQGIVPGHDGDRATIHGGKGVTKEELWKFLFEKTCLDACAYCTGNPPGECPIIPAAEQILGGRCDGE